MPLGAVTTISASLPSEVAQELGITVIQFHQRLLRESGLMMLAYHWWSGGDR
ncbi:MAG TPA: hypothetical protein G4O01_08780 [Dehalococcoidia bacterium]|jgi:hypothetical protein|nr:hypothetical protein [Dehalococcoidia bacterium]